MGLRNFLNRAAVACAAGVVFFFCLRPIQASENSAFNFSAADRVMVIAPHPDDETLGAGGVIQAARKAGASVKVVYLTHGEFNEISSLFYKKKPLLVKSDFIKSGERRKAEAIDAMRLLGLDEKDLIFFGYPDRGTLRIWHKYWGQGKPYRGLITGINKVLYKGGFSYGNYYKGDNIVHDFERALLGFEPTHVFVTAPFDSHADHQAACLYLEEALLSIQDELPLVPKRYWYLVHAGQWPPKGSGVDSLMSKPASFSGNGARWISHALTRPETLKKKEALMCYKSQIAYAKNFLLSFAARNEIFMEASSASKGLSPGGVRYELKGDVLQIELPLKHPLDELGSVTLHLFGHKRKVPFSSMPKIHIKIFGNRVSVKDGLKKMHDHDISYKLTKGKGDLRVPLSLLKDPDSLFVSVASSKEQPSQDFGSWRLLEIKSLQSVDSR